MQLRSGFWAIITAAGLMLVGCGKAETTPPSGTDMDTPTVDIDEGDIVAPDEITREDDSAAAPGTPTTTDRAP